MQHVVLPDITASQFSAENFPNAVFMTGFLHILAAWFICFCFAWRLHSVFFRLCVCFVFVFFPFLNQEADPCFWADFCWLVEMYSCVPLDSAPFFSPVFFTQSSAWFGWKLPQTHLPFLEILHCLYVDAFIYYTQISDVYYFCVIRLSSSLSFCMTLLSIFFSFFSSLFLSRCPPDRDEWGVRPGEVWVCCHQQRWDTLFHSS